MNAAWQLRKLGHQATVYEARNRLGGRVHSIQTAEGLVLELGGSFVNTDHADMLALVDEFGLELFDLSRDAAGALAPETAYYLDGRLRPEAEVADKLRALAEQITADADLLDADYAAYLPKFDGQSVAGYLDAHADRIPEPWVRTLVEQTIRTEYGVEPEESSALQLLSVLPTVDGQRVELVASDEVFVIRGGNGRLVQALANALPGQIHLSHVLTRLDIDEGGYRLAFRHGPDGGGQGTTSTVVADRVILAIPFTSLREVDVRVDLPAGLQRFIQNVDLGRNEKLFAGFSSKVWRGANGFARAVWSDLGFAEAWDGTPQQTERPDGMLTFYFGGRQVDRLDQDAAVAGPQRFERFERIVPGSSDASTGQFLRTDWSGEPFTRGAYTNLRPGQLTSFGEFLYVEEDSGERQDVAIGNLAFAGEQLSDAYYGYMNGAAQTGRLAAAYVARTLAQAPGQSS